MTTFRGRPTLACDVCWTVQDRFQLDSDDNCGVPPYTADPLCGDACQ